MNSLSLPCKTQRTKLAIAVSAVLLLAACGDNSLFDFNPPAGNSSNSESAEDTGNASGNEGDTTSDPEGTGNTGGDSGSGGSADTGSGSGSGSGTGDSGSGSGSGSGDGNTPDPGIQPTANSADSQMLLEWPVDENADSYIVYYDTVTPFNSATATRLNDTVGAVTGNSAIVDGLTNGTTYYAWVAPVTLGTEGTVVSLGDATPSAGGFDAVASQVQPPVNALEVNPNQPIVIPFNAALDPSTVTASSVKVLVNGVEESLTINLVNSNQTIEITPAGGAWQTGELHEVQVLDTVTSDASEAIRNALNFSFRTLDTAALVAWWDFDDSLVDSSGNNNTIDTNQGVTFSNAPGLRKSGSHSAYFDGSSYLTLSDINFDLGTTFAVATWIYIPSLQSNINTILANAAAGESSSGFKIGVNNWLQLNAGVILEGGNGSAGGKARSPDNLVQDGQWYHFAYNVDTSTDLPNGKHVQIFFNGEEAQVNYDGGSSGPIGSMDWSLMKTTGPIFIGAMVGGHYRLNGAYLDDLRIYNRPLTADEVRNIAR